MKNYIYMIAIFTTIATHSQSINNQKSQLWFGFLTNTKINNQYTWWNDAHFIPQNFAILRSGLTYNFNNKFKNNITAGISYAIFYPTENQTVYGNEWRPWVQGTMNFKDSYFEYLLRLRYEARFKEIILNNTLQNEFNFNNRTRLMLQNRHFFANKKNFYWMISEEILINTGSLIQDHIRIDQNRLSTGIGYKYLQTTFQIDYMNQLILSNKNNTFNMTHNLQLLIFHQFNL